MATVVDIQRSDDPRDVIHQAVHLLTDGQLVAFPSETCYFVAASSLHRNAINRLIATGISQQPAGCLALKGAQELRDYCPGLEAVAQRLARRCWPGPVVLAVPEEATRRGLLRALPAEAAAAATFEGLTFFRAFGHQVVSETLRLLPAPLLASTDWGREEGSLATAQEIAEHWGDQVALIIDDGRARYCQPATAVAVSGNDWRTVRPGVVTDSMLRRMGSEMILFVCTGNTCRSPLAEGIFRRLLSERLGCTEDELADRGYIVSSAGISAAMGAPASRESVELAARRGIDLTSHSSQPLTDQLINQADRIYAMTQGHRDMILSVRPDAADRLQVLSRTGEDVIDPMGGTLSDYEACEKQIEGELQLLLDEIVRP